ncbi:hypothetical protein HKX69_05865 [Streptomyces argyrophyllae]|uniref:Uncharacterized protein n=1 Tax=Streptomyces argyrophylli TaxID=2726118 RepID=A0A6M4PDM3_9ACTN|nr:hypothetical protein [Streptomyces argyrophyllae]QJS09102.1 hypothetical protein HKX69_05865 [Streptomyces argyrophyllae]
MPNEISYPFSADSAGGGQQMVSQQQWQYLARVLGKDRVDFRLDPTSIDAFSLPFTAAVVNGTSVTVQPGRAFVGGFYYQLTATATLSIAANSGSTGRIDLVVLRADLSAGSVNLAVVKGQPAASPKPPALTRNYGGVWEMPLHQVTVPAANGALSLVNVMPFDTYETVAVPWNAVQAASYRANGSFVIDMDSNNTDTQSEYWIGRDGNVISRDLSTSRGYTPSLVNVNVDLPNANKTGRWRWIAPGMVYFSVYLKNDWEDTGPTRTGASTIGVTLPTAAHGATGQVVKGILRNPNFNGGLPNVVDIHAEVAQSNSGQTVLSLLYPNSTDPSQGLDGLRAIPPLSNLKISGVYEAATFN